MKSETPETSPIFSGICEAVESGMVTSYVTICTWVDDDGDQRIHYEAMPDQRARQSMGLLSWALAVENRRVGDTFAADDDD